jgi:hypothetical protein
LRSLSAIAESAKRSIAAFTSAMLTRRDLAISRTLRPAMRRHMMVSSFMLARYHQTPANLTSRSGRRFTTRMRLRIMN